MRHRGRPPAAGPAPRAERGCGGRVLGRRLPGRPARLQHARVRRLRHARHEDQARVRPGGSGSARPDHEQRRPSWARRSADRWRWRRSARLQGPGSRASAGPARRDGATAGTRCSSTPRRPTSTRWRSRTFAPTGAARDPARAQTAGYKSRTFNVTGATRIVQRVICVGGDGRKSCSARGRNFLRTYEAEVRIADVLAPSATILGDTPLGGGAWVGGTQPLNYDASDNVGVRAADAIVAGITSGALAAPMRIRLSRAHVRRPCPVPERSWDAERRHPTLPRGHARGSSFRRATLPATSATRRR